MKIDRAGIDFIIAQEGSSATRYLDTADKWTIGVGHLIQEGETFIEPLSEEAIASLLRKDLRIVENCVNMMQKSFTQNQFNALCSLIFNIGIGAFGRSTVRKVIMRDGSLNEIRGAWLMWKKAGGMVSRGLLSRRFREIALYGS